MLGPVRRRNAAVLVIGVSALPWLSVKYVPVAATLALLGLYRYRRHRSTLAGIAIALAAMAVVYVVVHRLLYGGWTAYASGDYFAERGESRSDRYVTELRRTVSPVVGSARRPRTSGWPRGRPRGCWLRWRSRRCCGAECHGRWWLVLPVMAGWFVATFVALTMHGWWWPGRQVVVVLPLVVVAVAWAVDQFRVLVIPLVVSGVLGFATWCYTAFEAATRPPHPGRRLRKDEQPLVPRCGGSSSPTGVRPGWAPTCAPACGGWSSPRSSWLGCGLSPRPAGRCPKR